MRKSTIASLLILCGSTAALAQVTPRTGDPVGNTTTLTNDQTLEPSAPPAPDATPVPLDNGVVANTTEPPTGW